MSNLLNSVKVTELPPAWEGAADSAVILLLVKVCCPSFPLMFGISIRPVPEVSLPY